MHQEALSQPLKSRRSNRGRLRKLAARKIWLPRSTYAALPFLYIFLGCYAMAAALFLRHWSWIVPYLVLVGVGCVHAGAYILTLRWRRRGNAEYPGKPADFRGETNLRE
ncbi:MAG: hypothetical protein HKN56_01050 [Gammaproteobacteria bacterium]|nr:hypothetical protein [Gammaproteobacteria bacterium]